MLTFVTPLLPLQASGIGEVGWAELSPGFHYLEQMCRMLEKLAQLKMGHRGLQTETEQLRNEQNHRTQYSAQVGVRTRVSRGGEHLEHIKRKSASATFIQSCSVDTVKISALFNLHANTSNGHAMKSHLIGHFIKSM